MARMKAWLEGCVAEHPRCRRDGMVPVLPTRVLKVGKKGSEVSFLVKGGNRRGEYATLSHCWGGPGRRPLRTTDATLAMRERGIRDKKLPKTFREAIRVCRELGIEYLWIDSLCIIQDQASQEDWAEEAPKMGLVYGNSVLTIFAADAADSTEGCFRDRLGLLFWPCPIVLFGQQCYVSRYPTDREEKGGDAGDINPTPRLPLNERAWVLQEQILSRRSLIFTHDRLVWRCATMSTNEKYPFGMPHAPDTASDNHRLLHCLVNQIEQSSSDVDVYTCWYRMVQTFTARNITYQDDRLPAIAGIANKFAAIANDTYHAGLWRRDLLTGMLWISATLSYSEKNMTTRAPSWSWASVNCFASYLSVISAGCDAIHIPISPLLEIIDVIDPPTCAEHPFGATSKAMLRLSGALLPVRRDQHEESGLAFVQHSTGDAYTEDIENFLPDEVGLKPTADTPWFCLPVCVQHDSYVRGIRGDPEPYKTSWERSLDTGVDEFSRFNKLYCLVLQAVRGRQHTFSRVGACVLGRRIRCKIGIISLRERQTLTVV
jgi:hypothetical protein